MQTIAIDLREERIQSLNSTLVQCKRREAKIGRRD